MSYPLFPQRRKLRKWIFALPRVRQQIDQRAIGKGIARKSPLVSSVPLSLHTRLPCKAPYMHGKRKGVYGSGPRHRGPVRAFPSPCGLGRISSSAMSTFARLAELAVNTLAVQNTLHASQGRCESGSAGISIAPFASLR